MRSHLATYASRNHRVRGSQGRGLEKRSTKVRDLNQWLPHQSRTADWTKARQDVPLSKVNYFCLRRLESHNCAWVILDEQMRKKDNCPLVNNHSEVRIKGLKYTNWVGAFYTPRPGPLLYKGTGIICTTISLGHEARNPHAWKKRVSTQRGGRHPRRAN